MESEILKQLQKDYPAVPADVAGKMAAFVEKAAGDDAARRTELTAGAAEVMAVLSEKFSAYESSKAQLAEYETAKATAEQFRQALGKELNTRGVPAEFWEKTIAIDPLTAELLPAADAIEGAYKAYEQRQSDKKIDTAMRPETAVNTPRVSPAVENYLRSRQSDSPLAGKLKK